MKILIIPDVHGREFWVEPCSHVDEFDKIIFLGDYHDPYPLQVNRDDSRRLIRDKLVPFVTEHKDKCICLYGNHDLSYIIGPCADRFDGAHALEIQEYLAKLDLKLYYEIKDENQTYLFTHSGVLPTWLDENNLTLESFKNLREDNPALMDISPRRGGYSRAGSCVWGDLFDYYNSYHLKGIYQIFGHTQLVADDAFIDSDFACLDCRQAFILDTKTGYLTKYDSKH